VTMRALAWIALAACARSEAEPAPQEPPAARFEHDMLVRFHMHQNFDLMRAIDRLLLRGKLEEAVKLAEGIATAPDEPAHGPWAAQTVVVRDRAAALARATTVPDAIALAAKVGAACADCHQELGVSPELARHGAAPPDHATVEARMLRHRWAADRLWEGLITGEDDPWRAGLDVLAATPLAFPAERAALAKQLQRQADQARRAKSTSSDERAQAYGELLATCAGCHTVKR
jgi:cytochrome c556